MAPDYFSYNSIVCLSEELVRRSRSQWLTISISKGKHYSHSKDNRAISRLYDNSMIFCPNTGLRHLPADYKTVLDNFYLTCMAKKRNMRQEQKGCFMTAEQFVAGNHSFRNKNSKGRLESYADAIDEEEREYFVRLSDTQSNKVVCSSFSKSAKSVARNSRSFGKPA